MLVLSPALVEPLYLVLFGFHHTNYYQVLYSVKINGIQLKAKFKWYSLKKCLFTFKKYNKNVFKSPSIFSSISVFSSESKAVLMSSSDEILIFQQQKKKLTKVFQSELT